MCSLSLRGYQRQPGSTRAINALHAGPGGCETGASAGGGRWRSRSACVIGASRGSAKRHSASASPHNGCWYHSMRASPLKDSYHTVWFEFHEELIALTGRDRAIEEASEAQ